MVGSTISGEGIGYSLQYAWASLVAQRVKNRLQCRRPGFDPLVGKIPWRGKRLYTPIFWLGEFHGLYSPWGRKVSDMTERLALKRTNIVLFATIVKITEWSEGSFIQDPDPGISLDFLPATM